MNLLDTAVKAGRLKDGDRPGRFIKWALSKNIVLPDEILASAQENAGNLAEDEPEKIIDNLRAECRALREAAADQAAESQRLKSKKKPRTPREETMDLVILGCAMQLRYDPSARTNPAIKQIQNGVAKAGHQLDDETISNVLKHAWELKRSI